MLGTLWKTLEKREFLFITDDIYGISTWKTFLKSQKNTLKWKNLDLAFEKKNTGSPYFIRNINFRIDLKWPLYFERKSVSRIHLYKFDNLKNKKAINDDKILLIWIFSQYIFSYDRENLITSIWLTGKLSPWFIFDFSSN